MNNKWLILESNISKKVYHDRIEYRLKSNGKLHREDGPAIIYNYGQKAWYIKIGLQSQITINCKARST